MIGLITKKEGQTDITIMSQDSELKELIKNIRGTDEHILVDNCKMSQVLLLKIGKLKSLMYNLKMYAEGHQDTMSEQFQTTVKDVFSQFLDLYDDMLQ